MPIRLPSLKLALWVLIGMGCLPAVSLAQNTVKIQTNYYRVTGMTLPQIYHSITKSSPWRDQSRMAARTQWQLNWTLKLASGNNGCRVVSLQTKTTITMTLPLLTLPKGESPSAETMKRWQAYLGALMKHEKGHADLAREAGVVLQRKAKAHGGFGNCAALRNHINRLGQDVVNEFRARERAYDRKTRHGATQGAVLPRPRSRTE